MSYQNTRRMLWVFVAQTILIICLFAWGSDLPPWIVRVNVAAVIGLPLFAYLTVLAQPSARDQWRSFLRELVQSVVSIPADVRPCFRFSTLNSLGKFVLSMKVFPTSRDDWIALPLFPFKTYMIVAYPFVKICLMFLAFFHPIGRPTSEVGSIIMLGYLYSIPVLLVGALIQALVCRSGRATNTVFFVLYGIGLIWLGVTGHL